MMTASEYLGYTDARKRAFALAVDRLERLCSEATSMRRRMMAADITDADGRMAYERLEVALLCKRDEIYAAQTEYHLGGICVNLSADEFGFPIRVRRPVGFVSLERMCALPAERAETPKNGSRSNRRKSKAK